MLNFDHADGQSTMAYRYGIPAICNGRVDAVAGGLVSYGPDLADTWRQAGLLRNGAKHQTGCRVEKRNIGWACD
jgi:hypothetical protein